VISKKFTVDMLTSLRVDKSSNDRELVCQQSFR